MSKYPCLVIVVMVLSSLAACTGGPWSGPWGGPWTVALSSDHITLRWWADEVADAQAAGTAGAYCTQMGKAVETIAIERDGSASIGHYRCI
jgi:hypothetical protein